MKKKYLKLKESKKKINISESQYYRLFENQEDEIRTENPDGTVEIDNFDLISHLMVEDPTHDKTYFCQIVRRQKEKQNYYEIISGHRRKKACLKLGIEKVPAIIRELDDDSAILEMVDSNLQSENIKPSEKAYAYKMKLQALQNKAKANDCFGQVGQRQKGNVGKGVNSRKELAKQLGESERQIQRYIRLTNLIPKILQMVDDGIIAFTVAVELCVFRLNGTASPR